MHADRRFLAGRMSASTGMSIRIPPVAGAVATVAAGVVCTSIGVWGILSIRGWSLQVPTVAALSLAALYVGFFVSVFSGIEVMRAAEAGTRLSLGGVCDTVAAGFGEMLYVREVRRLIAACASALGVRIAGRR
jgi:Na+/H+ antiporter NhaC